MPYGWLDMFYSFYMAAIIRIFSGNSPLTVEAHHGNQLNKSKQTKSYYKQTKSYELQGSMTVIYKGI